MGVILGMIFSFLFKLSFSALYLISAIFTEIPQRGKFGTLVYVMYELVIFFSSMSHSVLIKFSMSICKDVLLTDPCNLHDL